MAKNYRKKVLKNLWKFIGIIANKRGNIAYFFKPWKKATILQKNMKK